MPCFIRTENAEEISLAENIVRQAMHPADQFEAFAALVDAGETVPAIASRFGVSERLVRQRLKLGKVAPKLLSAYRAEEMDLKTLRAETDSGSVSNGVRPGRAVADRIFLWHGRVSLSDSLPAA